MLYEVITPVSVPLFRPGTALPGLSDADLVDYLKSYLAGTVAAIREEYPRIVAAHLIV